MFENKIIIDKSISFDLEKKGENYSPLIDSLKYINNSYEKPLKFLLIDFRYELYKEIQKNWKNLPKSGEYISSVGFLRKQNIENIAEQLKIDDKDYDFIVFDLSFELANHRFAECFIESVSKNISSRKKIIFVCSNDTKNQKNNFYCDNFFEAYCYKDSKKIVDSNNSYNKKIKRFISLNRRPRPDRIEFVRSLYNNNLDQYFLLSHPGFDKIPEKTLDLSVEEFEFSSSNRGKKKKFSIKNFNEILMKENFFGRLHTNLFNQSYINVVTETMFTEDLDTIFVTEKTFRSIYAKIPFIIYGNPNILKSIKDMGYKTYHPFINENYDNEIDSSKRLKLIIDEIKRLSNLSESEFIELYKDCYQIAEWNHCHFLKRSETGEIGKKFIDFLFSMRYNITKEK